MSKIKLFSIPNLITICNLICGLFGIIFCFKGNITYACYSIYLAAALDFVDGYVARLFNASSELGKQLDSLCDVVSFGVLPGFIMYHTLVDYKELGLIIPLFSALRLAKFNIDSRQSDQFIGVPTPMNAFFIASISQIFYMKIFSPDINFLVIGLIVISSALLVSELPLMALKFKSLDFKSNMFKYLLIVMAVILLLVLKSESFAILYFIYLLLSLLNNFVIKRNVIHSGN